MIEILNRLGQSLVDRLRDDIRNKRVTKYGAVNASGRLADSVNYKINGNKLELWAEDYIYYLEKGRRPTRNSGTGEVRKNIRKWIDDKGINPTDISKDSLAYLIARKIHLKGNTVYQQGGSDLVSGLLNSEEITNIEDELLNNLATDIRAALTI